MGVSENEIGLREARAQLGELVNQAQYNGVATYITRHGHRVAAIVPIPQEQSMTAKGIRLTLDESSKDSGWNWAEAATEQWIDAAEKAGLEVSVISIEVPDVNHDAAIVEVDGSQYVLTVRNDEIRADLHEA